jgi:hypothetical protein
MVFAKSSTCKITNEAAITERNGQGECRRCYSHGPMSGVFTNLIFALPRSLEFGQVALVTALWGSFLVRPDFAGVT